MLPVEQALYWMLPELNAQSGKQEPRPLKEGMLAFADGTNWNPGSGKGYYKYESGAWNLFATYPLGQWVNVPYSAGNFTASGSMVWTVDSGDVSTFQYILFGKFMAINFSIDASSVSGTLSTDLKITIPLSKIVNAKVLKTLIVRDASVVANAGFMYALSGGTVINIRKMNEANWTASTNLTYVQGQIFFEIQ